MDATRTLTVFTISDPDEVFRVVLAHEPLNQTSIELRLRAVARQFGTRWGVLIGSDSDALREALRTHGFDWVSGDIFFGVFKDGQIGPEEPVGNSVIEQMAVAAVEPTADQRLDELCKFVREELGLDEDEATEELDSAVHDFKSGEAASINNGGLESQIEFCCAGMTLEQAKDYLRSELGKEEESEEAEEEDARAIDFTKRREGSEHEEQVKPWGITFCKKCGEVSKHSDPYFHGDSFLDIPILELTIEEEPDDEVSLCALVSKKLGVELTLDEATKYMAAAFDRDET